MNKDFDNLMRKVTLTVIVIGFLVVGVVGYVIGRGSSVRNSGATKAVKAAPGEAGGERAGQTASGADAKGEEGPLLKLDPAAERSAHIRVQAVNLSSVRDSLTVPGVVKPSTVGVARITPPVTGKVTRIVANLGDTVRAGQPLAELESFEVAQAQAAIRQAETESRQSQSRLQTAFADVEQARVGVRLAEAEAAQARDRQRSAETALQRQHELAKAGVFSQSPLQAAQSERTQAEAELLQAQTELQNRATARQRAERLYKEGIVARAELEQAQTEHRQSEIRVEQAQARVAIAKQALEREQKVFQQDLLSQREVQTAEAEVRAARGEVQKAEQGVRRAVQEVRRSETEVQTARRVQSGARGAVAAAHANLIALAGSGLAGAGGRVIVPAPISGVVTERNLTLGEAVERTSTLFVLENLNTVVVQASVAEKDVPRVRTGQPVEVVVASYPNERFTGVVQTVADHLDEKTRTLTVRCLIENRGGRLRPEMFGHVALSSGPARNALVVPQSAVIEDAGGQVVFVAERGGYEKRAVSVGRSFGGRVEVAKGLEAGEKVVVEGAFVLKSESHRGELKEEE